MITYDEYAKIRDEKKLTDGKIAEIAGFGRSTFSDWKFGRSIPKFDKMQKIAEALGMDYFEFVGPVGKFSSLNPNRPIPHLNGMLPGEISDSDKHLLDLYHNATSDAQTSVMILLEHSQKEKTPSEEI